MPTQQNFTTWTGEKSISKQSINTGDASKVGPSKGDTTTMVNRISEILGSKTTVQDRALQYQQAAANIKASPPVTTKPTASTVKTSLAAPKSSVAKPPINTIPKTSNYTGQQKSKVIFPN